jgi:serine/threonine protein kinase
MQAASSFDAAPWEGRLLAGRFRLERLLGTGATATVWDATDLRLGSSVALKMLRSELLCDATAVRRFRFEAECSRRVESDFTAQVFDTFPDESPPFFVMRLLQGTPLSDWLAEQGRVSSFAKFCQILFDVLRGLADAHRAGVVHRDLKPHNVFLEARGCDDEFRAILIDFGIAWDEGRAEPLTQTSLPLTGSTFLAPELALGAGKDSPTVDVYAAGILAFVLVTGSYPGPNPPLLHRTDAGRAIGMPPHVGHAVARAIAPAPRSRFPSADDFLAAVLLPPDPRTFEAGQLISERYEILHRAGQGGQGVVYRARDTKLPGHPEVALKFLAPPADADPVLRAEQSARFKRECNILTALRHPGIVQILAVDAWHGVPYYAMEWVTGTPLDDVATEHGWAGLLPVLRQVASALDTAHAHHIIHRDIKGTNILVRADGSPLLLDFGIAQLGEGGLTRIGHTVGTPGGMAPEQIRGQEVGPQTDQWGLAATLYKILTGRRPGDPAAGDSLDTPELHEQVSDGNIHPLGKLRPDLPTPAAAAIMRALAVQPFERFPSVTAFVHAIADGLIASRPTKRTTPARSSRAVTLAAAFLALAVGIAIGVAFTARPAATPKPSQPVMPTAAAAPARSPEAAPPPAVAFIRSVLGSSTKDGVALEIDGAKATTPYVLRGKKGERVTVRVSDPRYHATVHEFVLGTQDIMSIFLRRQATARRSSPTVEPAGILTYSPEDDIAPHRGTRQPSGILSPQRGKHNLLISPTEESPTSQPVLKEDANPTR